MVEAAAVLEAQLRALAIVTSWFETVAAGMPSTSGRAWIGSASEAYSRGLDELSHFVVHAHSALLQAQTHLHTALRLVHGHVG
jgi:hypothetical protein